MAGSNGRGRTGGDGFNFHFDCSAYFEITFRSRFPNVQIFSGLVDAEYPNTLARSLSVCWLAILKRSRQIYGRSRSPELFLLFRQFTTGLDLNLIPFSVHSNRLKADALKHQPPHWRHIENSGTNRRGHNTNSWNCVLWELYLCPLLTDTTIISGKLKTFPTNAKQFTTMRMWKLTLNFHYVLLPLLTNVGRSIHSITAIVFPAPGQWLGNWLEKSYKI